MSAYLDRSAPPAKPDARCRNGCGRRARRPDSLCYWCLTGRAIPEPLPELLRDEYLGRCVREYLRRRLAAMPAEQLLRELVRVEGS